MQQTIIAVLFLLASSLIATAQPAASLREATGRTLKSKQMPAVDLTFGRDFKYVGGHRFVLYDVANAEQHFYVDADKEGRIRRMYWVQFEGYLPSNTHTYKYTPTKIVNIGGLDFVADAWARNIKLNPGRPDGDGAKARAFLETKGYKLASDEVLSQRLVHLIGEPKRDELMIIYLEVSPVGMTAADVMQGGKDAAKWSEISVGLLARAQKDLKIRKAN
jgi:hypothetical protein